MDPSSVRTTQILSLSAFNALPVEDGFLALTLAIGSFSV